MKEGNEERRRESESKLTKYHNCPYYLQDIPSQKAEPYMKSQIILEHKPIFKSLSYTQFFKTRSELQGSKG